jgi:thioredoxin reductase (NADPH)
MHYHVLIVGAGPVGLACGIEAQHAGLSYIILEKGCLTNSLYHWPTFMTFFSSAKLVEIGEVPFTVSQEKPTRREALVYYRKVKEKFGLNVRLYEEVLEVKPSNEKGFEVISTKGSYTASQVVIATGYFDNYNPLNVPGEDLPKVTHYYKEPFAYTDCNVLVVGGRNSAIETALDLYRNGTRVTLVSREPRLPESIKYWLMPDIENRIKSGEITAYFNSQVKEIFEDCVELEALGTKKTFRVPNDFVFALTGYRPDFDFIASMGVDVKQNEHFEYNTETMETNIAGLCLAGVVAAGCDTAKIFIENGRLHAKQIIGHITSKTG